MKPLSRTLICVLALLLATPAFAGGKTYGDRDWSIKLRDNCGMPVTRGTAASLRQMRDSSGDRFLEFRLAPGDVGGCSTDATARHSAPFWERAELSQVSRMKVGKLYEISFDVQLVQGFGGDRESFFQIHAWAKGCAAYPPVMMLFDEGRFQIRALRGVTQNRMGRGKKGSHKAHRVRSVSLAEFRAAPRRVGVRFDTRTNPAQMQVTLDGRVILKPVPVEIAACGEPHVKLGIYRPGRGQAVSVARFDNVTVQASN